MNIQIKIRFAQTGGRIFNGLTQVTPLKWLRRGSFYSTDAFVKKWHDLKAGGRRVNLSEPVGEFYAASLFLLRFLWRLTKNEDGRAAYHFVGFFLKLSHQLENRILLKI
jgi:hypothetical protein